LMDRCFLNSDLELDFEDQTRAASKFPGRIGPGEMRFS
jgi:hypothetical protein